MGARVELSEILRSTLAKDIAGELVGDRIAIGQYRDVYEHATDSGLVVKLEDQQRCFCNVYEHQVWEHVRGTDLAKWFAPVIRISAAGTVLTMRRTTPIRREELPSQVPVFFTDLKLENWGLLDGQPVCHDYGNHLLLEKGMTSRLQKATWA